MDALVQGQIVQEVDFAVILQCATNVEIVEEELTIAVQMVMIVQQK
jgi:hypothetical protein